LVYSSSALKKNEMSETGGRIRETTKSPVTKRVLVAAAVLTCLFLLFDGWFLFQRSFIKKQQVPLSKDGLFSLPVMTVFYPFVVREGTLVVLSEERLSSIEASVPSLSAPGSAVPRKNQFQMISPKRFEIPAAADLSDWTLRLTPVRPDARAIDVAVVLRPAFQPLGYLLKAAFAFFVVLMILAALILSVQWIRSKPAGRDDLVRLAVAGFLGTAAAALIFFIFHPDLFFGFAVRHGARPLRLLVLNAAFGVVLVLLYGAFRKFRLSLYLWPLLLSAAGLLVYPAYQIPICGDSAQWMNILNLKKLNLFGAEFLSFPLNKAILRFGRMFHPTMSSTLAQVLTGKLMGILTLFALTVFISGETGLSRERKLLFLVLASTFGFSAFLVGYPEFGFYPLPFLIAAAISARRYLRLEGGRGRDLMLTAFWVAVAGLFHGSAWVVLPAVFLMPPLRGQATDRPASVFDRIKTWALAGLTWAAVVAAAFGIARALGNKISFQNASGGGDHGMFVSFFSGGSAETSGILAFELRYLWERTWAFFLALPLPLLIGAAVSFRKIKDELSTRFWIAAGFCYLIIFLFWNFDLGYSDFDLYTVPLTLLALFLLKGFLETAGPKISSRWEPVLIFLFALASPVFLLLQLTTQSGF
jgi:hypothetical protein